MKLLFAIVLWGLMLPACNPPRENVTFSADLVVKEVTDMLYEYHHVMEQEGFLSEFDYLDHSADFFWVPPEFHSALDYDSVSTILKANDQLITKIILKWDSLKVIPLREDLAQYYGIISSTLTDTTNLTTKGLLIETGLIIKRSDGWKLLNGHSTFVPMER